MELLTIVAIALSPLVAVLVTVWLQDRSLKRHARLRLLTQLLGDRYAPVTVESVRALNTIDLIYDDQARVRQLWRDWYDMLSNAGLNNDLGWQQRNKKRNELITAMAASLGYGSHLNHLDVDRAYTPQGIVDETINTQQLVIELLRVLRNTESLRASPRRRASAGESGSADSGAAG